MKRTTILVLLFSLLALAGGCSTGGVTMGNPIECTTEEHGRLILFAQAVPSSQLIPCVEQLPAGWQIESIDTRSGKAAIEFQDDALDVEVSATLTARCPTTGQGRETAHPLVDAYEEPGRLAFVFPGGCFAIEAPAAISADALDELAAALGYLTRDALRETTGWTL